MKRDTPEFVKRWNRCATPTGRSWRVDETYWRKIRAQWVYLPGDGSVWTAGGLHARGKARCGRNVAVYRSAAGSAPVGVAVVRVVGAPAVVAIFDRRDRRRQMDGRRRVDRRYGPGRGHHARLAVDDRRRRGVGLARRLHAQADPVARVVLRARAVLAPGVFVDHVVADGAVLVVGLGRAALHVLVLGLTAFDLVAAYCSSQHTDRTHRPPTPTSY